MLALHADNTQTVKQGQLLIELDPAIATVNLQAAEANLARVVRNVRAQFSNSDSGSAAAEPGAGGAGPGAGRLCRAARRPLPPQSVSGEELAHARDAVAAAQAAVTAAQGGLRPVPRQHRRHRHRPQSRCAGGGSAAARRGHRLRPYAHRRAGGRRDRPAHRAGRPAGRGRHAADGGGAAVQCLDRRQLQGSAARPHAGRPAGDGDGRHLWRRRHLSRPYRGPGRRLAAAPSRCCRRRMPRGNWIKIVQRVPVRIALDPKELRDHPLRVGPVGRRWMPMCATSPARWSPSSVGAGTTRADTGEDSGPSPTP